MSECFKIAIIGLGYVGLPLAQLFLSHNQVVYGIDISQEKIQKLLKSQSYLSDFSNADLKAMMATGRFHVGDSYQVIEQVDAMIICVPTPLDRSEKPDLTFVLQAVKNASPYLRHGQLVVLESTTYPGTTEEEIKPLIESFGLKVPEDISLAFSPERIDPGQTKIKLQEIPKVIGGISPKCTAFAKRVYETAFDRTVIVSSPKVAELTKVLENCQRFVNISFMNEMTMLCHEMKIDLWEAIHAASTKPYGFTPFFPGPGVGGHCIPVDPLYLLWKAKEYQFDLQFIDLAHQINEKMPKFVAKKVQACLSEEKPFESRKIFVLGATYKKDVNDLRESVAPKIIKELMDLGAKVNFFDPYVKELVIDDQNALKRISLTRRNLNQHDCTLILTNHSGLHYESIVKFSKLVIDTRNATGHVKHFGNVILL